MNAVWPDNRCIICVECTELTRSHVIPQAVGGELWSLFECRVCNARLGSTIEAGLKLDPCVRLGIEAVADQVPRLASGMRQQAPFVGLDGAVRVKGRWADGEFRACATLQADGSIVKDHVDADQDIRRQLHKRGAGDAEIAAAIEMWERAPYRQPVSLGRGISIRNSSVGSFAPDLCAARRVPDECLLAIAYRFLALVIGAAIYAPTLDRIRAALRQEGGHGSGWSVEWGSIRRPYEPLHGLALTQFDPHVVVRVCLFSQIVWDVAFSDVRLGSEPLARSYQITLGSEVSEQVA